MRTHPEALAEALRTLPSRLASGKRLPLCRQSAIVGLLEDLLAGSIAHEAARIAEERIREMFRITEFDPDEVHGFMNSEEAAKFLGLPYSSFRDIAPTLPRHAIAPARFGYLRQELLEWGR